jgi:hypothetical protein
MGFVGKKQYINSQWDVSLMGHDFDGIYMGIQFRPKTNMFS